MPRNPTKNQQIEHMEMWLRAILKHRPKEIEYDEFAYRRIISVYRDAARSGLSILKNGK